MYRILLAIMQILAIMAIMAEKLLYQNGQSCGQFMFLSQEWPNSRSIQKELSGYYNPVKSYGQNSKTFLFKSFLADFSLRAI